MRKWIAGIVIAALGVAFTAAEYDEDRFGSILEVVLWVSAIVLAALAVSYLPWPRLAKRILKWTDVRRHQSWMPISYPLGMGESRVVALSLVEPKKVLDDSLGVAYVVNPAFRDQSAICVIGDDIASTEYRTGSGWTAILPTDFDSTALTVGDYEVRWVVEGATKAVHRFTWNGEEVRTKRSLAKRLAQGFEWLLRQIA